MNAAATLFSMLLLLLSVPIFMVFGLGSASVAIWGMNLPWSTLIQVSFGSMTKHVLIAVPLFIFTGMVMLRGGAAARLVHFATTLVGHCPGGLGLAMILAMGFFAAFCGSILAAITAVGTIMIPKMVEQGYPKPFVIVLAASAAFLESLIPPSNAAILFSALTDVPVSRTFAAGFVPGLVLLVLLSIVVTWRCRNIRNPEKASGTERLAAFRSALPGLFTPVIILGGIYAGLLTPSESAAVAGVWAILIGVLVYRELTLRGLIEALLQTARIRRDICHHRHGDLSERRAHLQSGTAEAHLLLHRDGRDANDVLALRCSDLPDPRYIYRDRAGVLSDGADLCCPGAGAKTGYPSPIYSFRGLRRDWNDHTAGLCRYLHGCGCGEGKSGKGVSGSAAFRSRRDHIRRADDLFPRHRDLAAQCTELINCQI